MSNRKLILRVSLKILTAFGIAWLAYIFMAGFFQPSETKTTLLHKFDLSSLENDSEKYFSVNGRELLVIKYQNNYSVFWANDPVYGCKLEYRSSFIQAACIDIKYSLKGYSVDSDQWLLSPEYQIIDNYQLVIY